MPYKGKHSNDDNDDNVVYSLIGFFGGWKYGD